MDQLIRVLVVDDSAYVRKVLRQMLGRSPFLEVVGTARDGEEALEQVAVLRPDVVTLDLNMPRMDGLAFLQTQMARRPVPVLVVSAASEDGEQVLQALDLGAVDVVGKPTALASERILEIAEDLVSKVKAVARARVRPLARRVEGVPVVVSPAATAVDLIVIGASTGGPQALKALIPQLPADLPVPVAMVLHMPVGYTEMYARSLAEVSPLTVVEATEGLRLQPGLAVLARAGQHLRIQRQAAGELTAHLDLRPLDLLHRPAVDVLFQSVADACGGRVLGVVLTGMGADGTKGAAWIKAQGGRVLTEAEETCVVYGMPRAVVEAGLSDGCLPLHMIPEAILEAL